LFAVRLRYIFWNCIHSKTKRTIFNDNIHEALVQYSAKIISRIAVISLNYRSSVTAFKYSLEIISPFSDFFSDAYKPLPIEKDQQFPNMPALRAYSYQTEAVRRYVSRETNAARCACPIYPKTIQRLLFLCCFLMLRTTHCNVEPVFP